MLSSTPEEILGEKELRVLFWRTIWTMPEHLRRVITHLYICDRPIEEAALLMGVTQNTVQLLHDKALDNLRARVRLWH
jgi:DNA-directed RNA polymerase specialized sigma24 family protein